MHLIFEFVGSDAGPGHYEVRRWPWLGVLGLGRTRHEKGQVLTSLPVGCYVSCVCSRGAEV